MGEQEAAGLKFAAAAADRMGKNKREMHLENFIQRDILLKPLIINKTSEYKIYSKTY